MPDNELRQLYRAAYGQYQCVILNGEKAYNRYVNDFFAYHLPSVGLNEADMCLHVMHVFAVRELLELRRDLVDVFFTKDKFEEKDYLKMDKLFNSGKAIDVKPIALADFSDAQIEKLKVFVNSKDIFVDELETNDIKKLFACKLEHPLQASSNRNVAIFLGWLRYYKKVCQNAHLLFLCTKPRLSQAGALLLPKDFVSLSITFYTMTKIHFRPYNPNQTVLFPPRIDEDIAEHDPVRMVDALVESLTLESFRKLYKECGRSPYHPRMMLKVILYAYMNNIYSCRKIEKLLHRDIHYIWLAGYEKPDFITINRFRNRVKNEINEVFTQTVLLLSSKDFISLNVEYIDGTKIESKANKYTFVWRKTVERNRERLMKKIHILLGQIDNVIAQENSSESNEEIEFTPAMLTEMAGELRQALEQVPEPSTKEEKTALKKKRKQLKELEEHRDKLQEYDNRLDTLQDRNSYSKTDNDATFMRMKEDAMRNGQTKPGYNLQIGTGNQFITDFALFPNPTDTLTLIPFLQSFSSRYDRLAHTVVADSGYGSEENYRFMSENGMEAYVKYNYFHMEQRPRFKPDPFKAENFYYNEEQDFCICPMGQKMQRIGTRHVKTASGYVSENARYRAIRCEGCPLRCRCFKAKGNRTIELNHRLRKYKQKAKELLCSEEGLKHRGQRCIEPEAVFGQMKNNMNYKRFRHFGKDKVFMDFAFFAIAFNIKKMCAKMTKEGMDWLIRPFYELTVVLFRCCERINQRNPQNIAA